MFLTEKQHNSTQGIADVHKLRKPTVGGIPARHKATSATSPFDSVHKPVAPSREKTSHFHWSLPSTGTSTPTLAHHQSLSHTTPFPWSHPQATGNSPTAFLLNISRPQQLPTLTPPPPPPPPSPLHQPPPPPLPPSLSIFLNMWPSNLSGTPRTRDHGR